MASGQKPPNGRGPQGPSPIIPGRPGRPSFSLDALRELVERQFSEETANRADILLELDSEPKRRALIAEIADYVLAVEAITLSPADRRYIIQEAYRNLFTFGPLEPLLQDERVTEIVVDGPRQVRARWGLGKLQPVEIAFQDTYHLEGVLQRALSTVGAALRPDSPFLEVGVELLERATRISVATPPISTQYMLEIRLHPRQGLTLEALIERSALSERVVELLRAILSGGHGLLIVGEAGTGKTTLAAALSHALPADAPTLAVQRAAEMALPAHVQPRLPAPPTPQAPAQPFGDVLSAALAEAPNWLLVDEIRGDDEASALWDALTRDAPPRYVWTFRGTPQAERLRSALSMAIRRAAPDAPQATLHRALAERLPFVVTLRREGEGARVDSIAEWELREDGDALALRPLVSTQGAGWALTGASPQHDLPLPASWWRD